MANDATPGGIRPQPSRPAPAARWYATTRWLDRLARRLSGRAVAALGIPALLLGVLFWPGSPLVNLLALLLLGGGVVWGLSLWSYAWAVDEQGIWELFVGQRPKLHPWSMVRGVEYAPKGLELEVGGWRKLRLPWSTSGARELAEELPSRLGRPPSDAAVSTDQVCGWLGISRGGAVVLRAVDGEAFQSNAKSLIGMALAVGFLASAELADGNLANGLAGALGAGLLLAAAKYGPRLEALLNPEVSADRAGLHRGSRLVAGWDDVTGVDSPPAGMTVSRWVVTTTRGAVWLPDCAEADKVANTVWQLLEARRDGATLPRMTDISDAAISRAEASEGSAERGLSRLD